MMRQGFLVTGLILLVIASFLMIYTGRSTDGFVSGSMVSGFTSDFMSDSGSLTQGFTPYDLGNSGGYGGKYEAMGPFDSVALKPSNGNSEYRNTMPNEPLMGPAFEVGPDNLFMFKNNQCKPECCGASYACDGGCVCSTPDQRKLINMRGGNRTHEDGFQAQPKTPLLCGKAAMKTGTTSCPALRSASGRREDGF